MSAERPARRNRTARELAEKFGVSARAIRYIAAEPRLEFEARARDRQAQATALRDQGLTFAQIGEALGISRHAAAGLVRRARANGIHTAAA